MNIQGKRIWQHAAGDTNRDYVQISKDFDVILTGPGRYGPWPACSKRISEEYSSRKATDVRRFCEQMQAGDLVVLRMGTSEVHAVGEIAGGYGWHEEFGDVDGWDLQHMRRVRWLVTFDKPKVFNKYSLNFGDTTQELGHGAVSSWLAQLQIPIAALQRPVAQLPSGGQNALSIGDLAESIERNGITTLPREQILAQLNELRERTFWYSNYSESPSEHETVCHLALPLLELLGWRPEQIAIEWQDIDVALFEPLPRKDSNLAVVLEAKRRGSSCLAALKQANGYASRAGRSSCRRIILTDGKCYWVFVKRHGAFVPYAYLNLARPKPQYAVYRCAGAREALLAMTPGWVDSATPEVPTSRPTDQP
jgi:hypothetical protein